MKKMVLKKLASLLVAVMALAWTGAAQANDIIDVKALGQPKEKWQAVEYNFTTDGPTLFFSDSPEELYDNGILYRDTLSGSARLFFHHVNFVEQPKKLAVIIKNRSTMHPLKVTLHQRGMTLDQRDISEPDKKWLGACKAVIKNYLTKQQEPVEYRVSFGKSVELLTGQGNVLQKNQLVSGIVDLELSAPAEVSVLACGVEENINAFNANAQIQPVDSHPLRGTFAKADYHYVLKKPLQITDDNVYKLEMAYDGSMIEGVDKTTGKPACDYGNYGVTYTVDFTVQGKDKVQCLFQPLGGKFAGYGILESRGKRKVIALPKGYCMGEKGRDMVEIGKLRAGQYRFIWSPPGATNLPVQLCWKRL